MDKKYQPLSKQPSKPPIDSLKKRNSKTKNINPSQVNRSPNFAKKTSEEPKNKSDLEKIQTNKRIQNLEKKIAKMKNKYRSPKPKLNTPNYNHKPNKDINSKNNNLNSEIISHTRIQSGNTIKETIIYNIKGKPKGRSLEKKINNNLSNSKNLSKKKFDKEKRKNSKNRLTQTDLKNNIIKKNKDVIKETFEDLNNIETMHIDKEKKIINSKKEKNFSNSESEEENPSYKKFNSISVSINNNYNYNLSLNKSNNNENNAITNWNEKLQKIEGNKKYFDTKKLDINRKKRLNTSNNNENKSNSMVDELKIKKQKSATINYNNKLCKNKSDLNFNQNTYDSNKYKKEKNEKNDNDDKGGVFSSIMNYIFGLNKNKKLPTHNSQNSLKINSEKNLSRIIKRNTDKKNEDIKDGNNMLHCHNSLTNLTQKKININEGKNKNYNPIVSNSTYNLFGKKYPTNNKEESLNYSNSYVNRKILQINNSDTSFNKNICNRSMNNNMNNMNNINNNNNNLHNNSYSNSVFNLYDFQDKTNSIFEKDDLIENANIDRIKKRKRLACSPGQVYLKRKLNVNSNKTLPNTNKNENEEELRQLTFDKIDKINNNLNNYYSNIQNNNDQEFDIKGRKKKKDMLNSKFNSENLDENLEENLNINYEKKIQEIIININSKKNNKNIINNNISQSYSNLNLDQIFNPLNDSDIMISKLQPKQEIESCIITFNKPKKTISSCQMSDNILNKNSVLLKKHSFCTTKSVEMNDFLTENPNDNEQNLTSRDYYKKNKEIDNYPNINTELTPVNYININNKHKNLMYYNPIKTNPCYSFSEKNIFKAKDKKKIENISNINNNCALEIKNFDAPTPNANSINVQNSLDFINDSKNSNSTTPNSPKIYKKPFSNDSSNNKNNENIDKKLNFGEKLDNECKNIKTTSVKISLGDKIKNTIKEVNNFIYSKNLDKKKETEHLTYVKKPRISKNVINNEEDEKITDKNNYKININENIMKITNSIRFNHLNNIERIKINDNKRSFYEKYYNFYIRKPLISKENYYITKIKSKNIHLKKIKTVIINKNKKNKVCDNLNNSFSVNDRTSIRIIDDILGTKKNNRHEKESNKSMDFSYLKIFSKEISDDALFNLSQDEEDDDDIISVNNDEEIFSLKSSKIDNDINNEPEQKINFELNDNKSTDDPNNNTILSNTTNNNTNSKIYIPKKLSANKKNQNIKNQNPKNDITNNDKDINKFYCHTEDNSKLTTYNKDKANKIKEFYIDYEKNNISPKDDFEQNNNNNNRIICINIDLNQKKQEKGLPYSKESSINKKNNIIIDDINDSDKPEKNFDKKKINFNINEEIINILNVINDNNIQIVTNKLFNLLFKDEVGDFINNQYSLVEIIIEKILINSKNNYLYSKLCKTLYNKIEQKLNDDVNKTENLKTIINEELKMNFEKIFDKNKKGDLFNLIIFINGLCNNRFLTTKDTFYFYDFLIKKYNETTDKDEKKLILEYILEILQTFGKILSEENNLKYLEDIDKFINEDLKLFILNKNCDSEINDQLWEKINNLINLHKNGWKINE